MRKIYISYYLINDAIKHKDSLDAVAFCVVVKCMFVSSTVKNATIRNLKQMFGIGQRKLQRILQEGERLGLLSFDDNRTLVVSQIKEHRHLNFCYEFEHESKAGKDNLRSSLTVAQVVKFIRSEFVKNHVYIQKYNADAYSSYADPSCVKDYKRAKKICKSHNITFASKTLSNQTLAKKLNVSKRTVRNIVRPMVAKGELRRTPTIELLDIRPTLFTKQAALCINEEYCRRGYVYYSREHSAVCHRLADSFTLIAEPPLRYYSA